MRDFDAIERELGLRKFLDSPRGTMFFVPLADGMPQLIVRRFDRDWDPSLAEPFAELMRASQDWVRRDARLAGLVRVEQPTEVGSDFIARPHHFYHVSLDSYEDGELTPPPQLAELRERFAALARNAAPDDELLVAVLGPSILEPTSKTFWEPDEGLFVVVEPSPATAQLEAWAATTRP